MTEIRSELTSQDALKEWLLAFHESTARLDAKSTVEEFFAKDVELCYANNPPVNGKKDAEGFFDTAFKALDLMHHDIEYFDFVAPNKLYQAATIKYVIKGDDPEKDMITIPAMMVASLVEEDSKLKIGRNEIYLDASAVFGRMIEKGLM